MSVSGGLRQIIHMDMKSANILLARDMTAKIAVRAGAGCLCARNSLLPTPQGLCSCCSVVGSRPTLSPPNSFRHADLL